MPKINIRLKKQAIKLHLVRSVHLDARMNHARNVIHDFGCSVQLVARPISLTSVFLFVQQVARYGFTLCAHTTTMTHKG